MKVNKLINILVVGILLFLCLTIVMPFWNQVVLSFSPSNSSTFGQILWPSEWTTTAYQYIYKNMDVFKIFLNTILRTLIGTLVILSTTILTAYPLSQPNLPFRRFIFTFFLIAMYVSGGMIPEYLVVRQLGLLNSLWALILPRAVNVFYIFIVYRFFINQNRNVIEAARLDGANPFQELIYIVIPSARPILVTIGLWSAIYHWNEWFHAKIYMKDKGLMVLQSMLQNMLWTLDPQNLTQNTGGVGVDSAGLLVNNVQAATVVILILPILIVYPFVQKYIIQNIDFVNL